MYLGHDFCDLCQTSESLWLCASSHQTEELLTVFPSAITYFSFCFPYIILAFMICAL